MNIILFQKGCTSWGFQIGRVFWNINKPRFWRTSGLFGYCGIIRKDGTK